MGINWPPKIYPFFLFGKKKKASCKFFSFFECLFFFFFWLLGLRKNDLL